MQHCLKRLKDQVNLSERKDKVCKVVCCKNNRLEMEDGLKLSRIELRSSFLILSRYCSIYSEAVANPQANNLDCKFICYNRNDPYGQAFLEKHQETQQTYSEVSSQMS
jgi:hypothetical protein